jgi:uncharacterized protein YndB with AHSA1/START domain
MIDVQSSVVIERPVDEVFAYVADLTNNPAWEGNFTQVERTTEGPIGVGTVFTCQLRVPGRRVTSRIELTGFEPGQRIAFRGNQPASAKPVGSITFEPVDGGTRVTTLPRPEFAGPLRLLEPLMAGYVRRSNAKHLAALKALLEARPAAP